MAKGRNSLKEIVMRKFVSGALATVLAASFVLADLVAADAAVVVLPKDSAISSDIQNVAWRGGRRHGWHNGGYYWNGHRGYRYHRPGYRRHGDFWFPLAAFATGAIVSGAIANDGAGRTNAHVRWCYDHYRSYRASDNTFQPTNGPRTECRSPY
jgi:hypothetical protein